MTEAGIGVDDDPEKFAEAALIVTYHALLELYVKVVALVSVMPLSSKAVVLKLTLFNPPAVVVRSSTVGTVIFTGCDKKTVCAKAFMLNTPKRSNVIKQDFRMIILFNYKCKNRV
ncbi:MAG: hypothetical protein JWP71_1903 [Mucilaginibacter sp.]|nr:hypothetical protein [Mucilaginibacter sp.]